MQTDHKIKDFMNSSRLATEITYSTACEEFIQIPDDIMVNDSNEVLQSTNEFIDKYTQT